MNGPTALCVAFIWLVLYPLMLWGGYRIGVWLEKRSSQSAKAVKHES